MLDKALVVYASNSSEHQSEWQLTPLYVLLNDYDGQKDQARKLARSLSQ